MFELLLTLCLDGQPDACRDTLVPDGPFPTETACEAARPAHPGAICAPAQAPLAFEEVGPGVFVHVGRIEEPDAANLGDVANIGFVIGDAAVAVIDAGSARWLAEGTWRAIRARTDLPIGPLILTHVHPDHLLGAGFFAEAGVPVIAHQQLNASLADRAANYEESFRRLIGPEQFAGGGAVAATEGVAATRRIDLGNRPLELRAWPSAHTDSDLTVLDGTTGILFAGDLLFDRHAPALEGSVLGWQAVLGDLAAEPLAAVVPGHGGPLLPWPEGSAPLARYLEVLTADTRQAIAEGARIGEASRTIAASEAGTWALFDDYNPRNAIAAFTELEWE